MHNAVTKAPCGNHVFACVLAPFVPPLIQSVLRGTRRFAQCRACGVTHRVMKHVRTAHGHKDCQRVLPHVLRSIAITTSAEMHSMPRSWSCTVNFMAVSVESDAPLNKFLQSVKAALRESLIGKTFYVSLPFDTCSLHQDVHK